MVGLIEWSVRRQASWSDAESRADCPLQGYAFCAKRKAGYRALGARAPLSPSLFPSSASFFGLAPSSAWRPFRRSAASFLGLAPSSSAWRPFLRSAASFLGSAPASSTWSLLLRLGAYFFDPTSGLPLAADISLGTTLRLKDVTTSPVEICTRWIFFEAGSET